MANRRADGYRATPLPDGTVLILSGHGELAERAGVPVEFVARSHLPLLDFDAQVDLMEQLARGVAPFV